MTDVVTSSGFLLEARGIGKHLGAFPPPPPSISISIPAST